MSLVSLAQHIESYAIGNANQFNGHSESKSGAIGNQSVLLENNAKSSLERLSVSQNYDALVKETKSLGRLSVFQNPDPGKEFFKEVLPCKLFFESFNSWFTFGFGYCIFLCTLFFKKPGSN